MFARVVCKAILEARILFKVSILENEMRTTMGNNHPHTERGRLVLACWPYMSAVK